jgi:hypothetical protein
MAHTSTNHDRMPTLHGLHGLTTTTTATDQTHVSQRPGAAHRPTIATAHQDLLFSCSTLTPTTNDTPDHQLFKTGAESPPREKPMRPRALRPPLEVSACTSRTECSPPDGNLISPQREACSLHQSGTAAAHHRAEDAPPTRGAI